jgi:hypothetical protein
MNLEKSLSELVGASAAVSPGIGYPEAGMASIALSFANGARLEAEYWRLVIDGTAEISSFDHQQKYGLPARIDALAMLDQALQGKVVTGASLDDTTGDLHFEFGRNIILQVFNFSGYEIWHIHFPDGTGEYSNHVRRSRSHELRFIKDPL